MKYDVTLNVVALEYHEEIEAKNKKEAGEKAMELSESDSGCLSVASVEPFNIQ